MAINSISGTSRINSLADLWAEKIQANKEARNGQSSEASVSNEDGRIRVSNPGGMKVGGAQAAEEKPTTTTNSPARSRSCRSSSSASWSRSPGSRPAACLPK